jgi:hypothetical protein
MQLKKQLEEKQDTYSKSSEHLDIQLRDVQLKFASKEKEVQEWREQTLKLSANLELLQQQNRELKDQIQKTSQLIPTPALSEKPAIVTSNAGPEEIQPFKDEIENLKEELNLVRKKQIYYF